MREEVRLKNMEEKIEIFEAMRNAILENETTEIYLPVIFEDRFWYLVGNRKIVIQESKDKIVSVFFVNEMQFNIAMSAPINIAIQKVDETVESFTDDLYKIIEALKYECERIRKKIRKAV